MKDEENYKQLRERHYGYGFVNSHLMPKVEAYKVNTVANLDGLLMNEIDFFFLKLILYI